MTDTIVQTNNYIVKTPGFRRGEPYFAGRHLAVEVVVDAYINHGASVEDVAQAYDLTPAQIHAALAYYYDHTDEFKAIWDEIDRIEAEHKETPDETEFRDRMKAKLKARRAQND
jgi:uncharacterized protein (DUF433 family)